MGFVPAKSLTLEDKAKYLVHGNSGAGKSRLGATAKRPAIALFERQALRTIRSRNPDAAVWVVESMDYLREMLSELRLLIANDNCPYDTVVIDSLTEAQGMLKKEILSRAGSERETLTQGEWGVIIDRVSNITRAFRDLPMHVLVLCRSEETYTGDDRFVRPSLSGKKLPNDIAGFFNAVGYIFKKLDGNGDIAHRVLFDGTEGFLTKGDPDLDAIEIPHWPAWIRKMYGPEAIGAATDEDLERIESEGTRELKHDGKTRSESEAEEEKKRKGKAGKKNSKAA